MSAPERDRQWIPIDVLIRAAELRQERYLDEHGIRTDSAAVAPGGLRSTGRVRSGSGRVRRKP